MPHYMAESYLAESSASGVVELARRAGECAQAMASEGTPVVHVRTTYLPGDEMCLHFFEARSAAEVAEALRRAAVVADRIVAAVHQQGER